MEGKGHEYNPDSVEVKPLVTPPMNFKARKTVVDGKEILVIDPIIEEITLPDGRQDVIVHAPSLELIKQFKDAQNIQ